MSAAVAPAATDRLALLPHQEEAIEFARPLPGALWAMEMGTMKSRCAIELLDQDDAQRILILCPKSVVAVWPDQAEQWSSRTWTTWAGEVRGTRGPLRNPSVAKRATAIVGATKRAIVCEQPLLVVVNYEAAHVGDMAEILTGTAWDAVVLDESHRLKSPSGKSSKLAAKVCAKTRGRGGRVLALTGTPMPHSPLDLWAQYRALDGGTRLGTSYHAFCQAYGAGEQVWAPGGIQRTRWTGIRPERLDLFREQTADLMHQVRAADVLDLPAASDVYRTCELAPAARRVYDALERDLIADLDDEDHVVTAANAMVLVLRLAQAASGFARDADTGELRPLRDGLPDKARLLADLLEDLPAREPIVVFCRFHADLDAVRAVAERAGRAYGELSGRRRDGLDGPRMSETIDVLGCQLASGGVGIDLTRAAVAAYYSTDFKLAEHDQSRARLHRPGQARPVTYVHLLAQDTIDQAVYGALRSRREVVSGVLDHLKGGRDAA